MAGPVQQVLRDQQSELRRLRWLLASILLALLIPTTILAGRAYSQLGYESLHRYRLTSENIAQNIETALRDVQAMQAQYQPSDYGFFKAAANGAAAPTVSPLAQLSDRPLVPGLLGHFLIDGSGLLRTPLLPTAEERAAAQGLLSAEQINARAQQQAQISALLAQLAALGVSDALAGAERPAPSADIAGLAEAEEIAETADLAEVATAKPRAAKESAFNAAPSQAATNQIVFEQLVKRDERRAAEAAAPSSDDALAASLALKQSYLKRQTFGDSAAPPAAAREAQRQQRQPAIVANSAQTEADSAEMTLNDATRFDWLMQGSDALQYLSINNAFALLYRRHWQSGSPLILGFIVEREPFFAAMVDTPFLSALDNDNLRMILARDARPVRTVDAGRGRSYSAARKPPAGGELLYRSRLPGAFAELQLVFSARQIGLPPGGGWILGASALLLALLLAGFALIYRFGVRELERRTAQQNFVSAVSHELKTPLTAIRMYGEMLKSGWVAEEKKPGYYDFIFTESERLSRLISNVLRLSQISRDQLVLTLKLHTAAEIMDMARSKLQTLAQQQAVDLRFELPEVLADAQLQVDLDAVSQVLINLVDNAIKFGGDSAPSVVVTMQGLPSNLAADRHTLCLSVRDHGPGIPKAQLSRIFDLFYRGESELTRQTQGTGIGLALVAELVAAMHGRIEARNVDPGACFSVYLPLQK